MMGATSADSRISVTALSMTLSRPPKVRHISPSNISSSNPKIFGLNRIPMVM
ncbi:Uncharacterised protein [Vibrio cholerae]|uniref:Uncharacterized protein n=1 Tax=Vibrio cholerae TaxID=666 RepID=A0A655X0Y1_VIBCL|nr:Uncharacterised protein [Vibrio cholerae]CSA41865.1 Uncharacterised protein [Vibrio cholerae]CSB14763.1 Uncharacterised protein [Vibrio cholerae]CSB45817.1 Uncharacterised protein [Vibrio cholerae]CSB47140.1 Uncharacterised protein [Vibrio cholerae]